MGRYTILGGLVAVVSLVGPAIVTADDDRSVTLGDGGVVAETSVEDVGAGPETRTVGGFDQPTADGAREQQVEELEGPESFFVPISSFRVYDSRIVDGKWIVGDDFLLDVLFDQFGTQVVPSYASAVTFNVTAAATEGGGYVQVYGPGTESFSTSTVNWRQSGLAIANSGSTMLGHIDGIPGFMGVAVGGSPGSRTHVIIDITGFYAPA